MNRHRLITELSFIAETLQSEGFDVRPVVIEGPATPDEVADLEVTLGSELPAAFRSTLLTISRRVEFRWFEDETRRFPPPFHFVNDVTRRRSESRPLLQRRTEHWMRVRAVRHGAAWRTRSTTLLMASLSLIMMAAATSCEGESGLTGGRTPAEVSADGEAEVERHRNDPLAAPIDGVPELQLIGELMIVAASANQDRGEIFGSVGVKPTRFTWAYDVADDADVEVVLDAAAAAIVDRGATLDRSIPLARSLSAMSEGDRLTIELLVMESRSVEIAHTIIITS